MRRSADRKPARSGIVVSIATRWGDASVTVEVASTRAEIERGLMYRDYLAPGTGMLFLMEGDHAWRFYMRNTRIPLDMIFIARDLTVAGVVPYAVPYTETLRGVDSPSRYVLEVNGGWAAAHRVAEGARVQVDVRRA